MLMIKLGYLRYMAQGGDWGSIIARQLASKHAHNCVGIHLNMIVVPPPLTLRNLPSLAFIYAGQSKWVLTPQENAWYAFDGLSFTFALHF
jgi:microsomal epoxide hydrolase